MGQNDARTGYNHCGYAWTLDGGAHWGDETPPFFQVPLLDKHAAEACSDPTVAWDSQGDAYIASTIYRVGAPQNAVVVAKSNPGIHGVYFHSPDAQGGFQEYRAMPMGVVSNEDVGFQDKPYVVADAGASSPKRDWVYVTWTRIGPEQEDSPGGVREVFPIIFSQSEDGGVTWSAPIEISGEAEGVCPTECNLDHASRPFVGPDGTIYVSFGNDNAIDGGSQILMVKCPADADCTQEEAWTEPVIVSNLVGGEPVGPSDAGCPVALQCLPPSSYRMSEANVGLELGRRPGSGLRRLGRLPEQHESRLHGLGDDRNLALRQRRLLLVFDRRGRDLERPDRDHTALDRAFWRDGAVAAMERGHA